MSVSYGLSTIYMKFGTSSKLQDIRLGDFLNMPHKGLLYLDRKTRNSEMRDKTRVGRSQEKTSTSKKIGQVKWLKELKYNKISKGFSCSNYLVAKRKRGDHDRR